MHRRLPVALRPRVPQNKASDCGQGQHPGMFQLRRAGVSGGEIFKMQGLQEDALVKDESYNACRM